MRLTKLLRQGRGKLRRYYLLQFRRDYVDSQLENRRGECNQCGNCCEILFKCPFLIRDGSATLCSIYEDRPGQCAAFPIDEKCLSEVEFDCTYVFGDAPLVDIEPPPDVEEPERIVERFINTRPIPIVMLAWLLARKR